MTNKDQHTQFISCLDEYQYVDSEMHKIIDSIDPERLYDRAYVHEIGADIQEQIKNKEKIRSDIAHIWGFDVLPDWAQVIFDGLKENNARWNEWAAQVEKL